MGDDSGRLTGVRARLFMASFSRPVTARASRTALIVASVPELTIRTISTEAKRSTISCASSTSASVGAP